MVTEGLDHISPMHELEVWCASTRRWVSGYWFERLCPTGSVWVRRGTDQVVLPEPFAPPLLRQARRSGEHDRVVDVRPGSARTSFLARG